MFYKDCRSFLYQIKFTAIKFQKPFFKSDINIHAKRRKTVMWTIVTHTIVIDNKNSP